jgi:hypothetical protein
VLDGDEEQGPHRQRQDEGARDEEVRPGALGCDDDPDFEDGRPDAGRVSAGN